MRVYRIANKKFASLEGLGGVYSSGRWHEKGNRIVYTSESRSLAAWEMLMHIPGIDLIPAKLVMIEIEVSADVTAETVPEHILSPGWNKFPHLQQTMSFGTEFLKNNRGLILKIPSAVIANEFNFILNPNYPDFDKLCRVVSIEPFQFDERLKHSK